MSYIYIYILQDLSYKDVHWHDKCFNCSSCSTTLINEPFAFKNNRLYCSACYEDKFAPRCVRCNHVFRVGMTSFISLSICIPSRPRRHADDTFAAGAMQFWLALRRATYFAAAATPDGGGLDLFTLC